MASNREKHPTLMKWLKESGLFLLVSILITIFKYIILQFLPKIFSFLPLVDYGFPGVNVTMFHETFRWYILGYSKEQGGMPYFYAYMIAMVIGEVINFFMQRSITFKSHGKIWKQGLCYLLAFIVVTFIVNSLNCIWVSVMIHYVPDFIYNIVTIMLNGFISMIVFFFVNKWIFTDEKNRKSE